MKNYELMNAAQTRIEEYFHSYNEGLISDEEAITGIKIVADAVFDQVERLYSCVWGDGYEPKEPITVHITHFTADMGYDIDAFKRIADLVFGESVTFFEGGVHSVTRVK